MSDETPIPPAAAPAPGPAPAPAPERAPAAAAARAPAPAIDVDEPAFSLPAALVVLGSAAGGALLAAVVLPAWLPGLTASLLGPEPKAYWYLSRSSAFVSFVCLWLSMAFGLLITNRLSRLWPGAPATVDLHQFFSLLGLAFGLFHALILLGDRFIGYTPLTLLVPFAGGEYRPLWVGLGQVGFYLTLIVSLSVYARKRIGQKNWRRLHYASFLCFVLVLAHGILSGTDGASLWARAIYWIAGGSTLFLTAYRIFRGAFERTPPPHARPTPPPPARPQPTKEGLSHAPSS